MTRMATPKARGKTKRTNTPPPAKKNQLRESEQKAGPKRPGDELTRHEVYVIIGKLESLGKEREPAETHLLDKLRRW